MQVRILKPTKSSMQSANGNNKWLLEFVKQPNCKFKEFIESSIFLFSMASFGNLLQSIIQFFKVSKELILSNLLFFSIVI